jgi:hypothetical protein
MAGILHVVVTRSETRYELSQQAPQECFIEPLSVAAMAVTNNQIMLLLCVFDFSVKAPSYRVIKFPKSPPVQCSMTMYSVVEGLSTIRSWYRTTKGLRSSRRILTLKVIISQHATASLARPRHKCCDYFSLI